MPPVSPTTVTRYHLRVELDDIAPPIWRRFWIDGDRSLYALHRTLQVVMGWLDYHLHEFHIGGVLYAAADPEEDRDVVIEQRVKLEKVLNGISRFVYVYDYGDDWHHTITVEKRETAAREAVYSGLVAGARACPPEDCGGPWRYQEMMNAIGKKRRTAEVREFMQWLGEFDPERFDVVAVDRALRRKGWNREMLRGQVLPFACNRLPGDVAPAFLDLR